MKVAGRPAVGACCTVFELFNSLVNTDESGLIHINTIRTVYGTLFYFATAHEQSSNVRTSAENRTDNELSNRTKVLLHFGIYFHFMNCMFHISRELICSRIAQATNKNINSNCEQELKLNAAVDIIILHAAHFRDYWYNEKGNYKNFLFTNFKWRQEPLDCSYTLNSNLTIIDFLYKLRKHFTRLHQTSKQQNS